MKLPLLIVICSFILMGEVSAQYSLHDYKSGSSNSLCQLELNDSMTNKELVWVVNEIYKIDKIPVLYYSGDWCKPCLAIEKLVKEEDYLKRLNEEFVFIKVRLESNSENNQDSFTETLAKKRNVRSVPMFTKLNIEGEDTNRISGSMWITEKPDRVEAFIEKLKKNHQYYHFPSLEN